jgi:hypothetical protein
MTDPERQAMSSGRPKQFGFRLIVEEGLSHAGLSERQDCPPVRKHPNESDRFIQSLKTDFPGQI